MVFLKITLSVFIFFLLTVLTQVGGLIYLLTILTYKYSNKWAKNNFQKICFRLAAFLTIYFFAIFTIVPLLAKQFGRVRLPLTETNNLQPLNVLTFLLNRNYVRPELRRIAFDVAKKMNEKYPGTTINYLDANFPFINKFPLFPHLSHNDGEKLDLSFCYRDIKTGKSTNNCPSFIGYGVCEDPLPREVNYPEICENRGNWQYVFMSGIVSQKYKELFTFDGEKTKALTNLFAKHKSIGKIFIEPHLKERLNLNSNKIRFHGCSAVRHDDHIHVQLK
jgi:hypothetical protein